MTERNGYQGDKWEDFIIRFPYYPKLHCAYSSWIQIKTSKTIVCLKGYSFVLKYFGAVQKSY